MKIQFSLDFSEARWIYVSPFPSPPPQRKRSQSVLLKDMISYMENTMERTGFKHCNVPKKIGAGGAVGAGGFTRVLDFLNLRIPQPHEGFLGPPIPIFSSYSRQLNPGFTSHHKNNFVGTGAPHQWELGGSTCSEHLTVTRASLSSLLPAI